MKAQLPDLLVLPTGSHDEDGIQRLLEYHDLWGRKMNFSIIDGERDKKFTAPKKIQSRVTLITKILNDREQEKMAYLLNSQELGYKYGGSAINAYK